MPSQLCIKQSSLYVNNLFKNENNEFRARVQEIKEMAKETMQI